VSSEQASELEGGQASLVGRLAPSPTGDLHLGHARSFLIAWWQARHAGGSICLRFEDLDADRASAQYMESALQDFEWLGIDWDGPVRIQSQHRDAIVEHAHDLLGRGLAYPCVCSRSEINALAAPHAGESEPRYPGTCRGRFRTLEAARELTGKPAGLRFCAPDEQLDFNDGVQGLQGSNPQRDSGDFLILRRDGTPAYQLAVVVDDAAQAVNSVVRGADLIGSTPKQLALIAAFGFAAPRYWHVPLVTDVTGRRLAKRDADLSLKQLREAGADPKRIVAWAANTCGFDVGARSSAREIVPYFVTEAITTTSVAVDLAELQRSFGC
jgi:glutamyl-tRNA synthetase